MLAGYIPHACSKALCLMCGSTEEEALYMHIASYCICVSDKGYTAVATYTEL